MTEAALTAVVPRTLSDEATDRLRDAIRRGALGPGTRLVERDLAQQLAMSRIPIREAISRLIQEGLIHKTPHRGTFVYAPNPEEIEEISSLRVVLERFVVERVMSRLTPVHEAELASIVEEMRAAAEDANIQRLYELDLGFHRTLWEIADHSLLLEVVSKLRSRINHFLYQAAASTKGFQFDTYIAAHETLLRMLKGSDVAAAQDEMTAHIANSKDRILASIATVTGA